MKAASPPVASPTKKPSRSFSKPSPPPGTNPGEAGEHCARSCLQRILDKASGDYIFKKSDKSTHTSAQMAAYWTTWVEKYPIVSIEDGMAEDDWSGWKSLTQAGRQQIIQEKDSNWWEMTSSSPTHHGSRAASRRELPTPFSSSSIRSVPSPETIDAIEMARKAGYNSIVSHRSGETEDTFIADLAVANRRRPRSKRAPPAAPTASPSTTSSSASRKNWAPPPASTERLP